MTSYWRDVQYMKSLLSIVKTVDSSSKLKTTRGRRDLQDMNSLLVCWSSRGKKPKSSRHLDQKRKNLAFHIILFFSFSSFCFLNSLPKTTFEEAIVPPSSLKNDTTLSEIGIVGAQLISWAHFNFEMKMFGYQGSDCRLKVWLTAGCELKQNYESRGLGTSTALTLSCKCLSVLIFIPI